MPLHNVDNSHHSLTSLFLSLSLPAAFMTGENVELRASEVDINPQYADSMEVETFTLHLSFEPAAEDGEDADGAGSGKQSATGKGIDTCWAMSCRRAAGGLPLTALLIGSVICTGRLEPYKNAGLAGFEAGLEEVSMLGSLTYTMKVSC